MKLNQRVSRAGFSLVEVAIAMMVMAVGVMAIFAIFPKALDLGRENVDRSYGSLFAEDVANGVRAKVMAEGMDSLILDNLTIQPVAFHAWDSASQSTSNEIKIDRQKHVVSFVPERGEAEDTVRLVYQSQVEKDRSDLEQVNQVRLVTLVWPYRGLDGAGKPVLLDSERVYFYTTIMNPHTERYQ